MGYIGCSMSERAAEAYERGELPKSRWTKRFLTEEVLMLDKGSLWSEQTLRSCLTETLQEHFLYRSSWHHTGKYYSETDFYSVDPDAVAKGDVDALRARDRENRKARMERARERERSVSKGTITFEVWEGSRRHGRFQRYTLPCLIAGKWAYTQAGKKDLAGKHVISFEIVKRAPAGTGSIYQELYKLLPKRYG